MIAVECAEGAEKCFLHNVFRCCRIRHEIARQIVGRIEMRQHQFTEGAAGVGRRNRGLRLWLPRIRGQRLRVPPRIRSKLLNWSRKPVAR